MPRPVRAIVPYAAIALLAWMVLAGRDAVPVQVVEQAAERPAAKAAGRTLHLQGTRCVKGGRLRLRIAPPTSGGLTDLVVTADGREELRFEGVVVSGRATLRLPPGRTTVLLEGTTFAGNAVQARRTYTRCRGSRNDAPAHDEGPIFFGGDEN